MFERRRLRRWVAAASALLALNAAVLQGGWACERAAAPPVASEHHHHGATDDGPAPSEQSPSHHDSTRCPLMAACNIAAIPDVAMVVPSSETPVRSEARYDATHAIVRNVAPEPPPPRA